MSRIITGRGPRERKRYLWSRRLTILEFGGDKSFVDDLNTEQGAVSSRVALLLRSAEAKPMLYRFVSCLQWDSGQLVLSSKKYFSPSHSLTTSTVVLLIFIAFFLTLKPLIFFHIYIYYFSLLPMINWLGPTSSYTKILLKFPFIFFKIISRVKFCKITLLLTTAIRAGTYRIPSDLRSQARDGSVSTVVGDHTGILGAVVFFFPPFTVQGNHTVLIWFS